MPVAVKLCYIMSAMKVSLHISIILNARKFTYKLNEQLKIRLSKWDGDSECGNVGETRGTCGELM